jgi:succinoglycan biosynthesis protein ExoO
MRMHSGCEPPGRRRSERYARCMPKVTVIIPAYNARAVLERAVRSALVQTEQDLEVIVVDDGSTDRTLDVASRCAEEDRRVRVVGNGENRGVSASRNRAIGIASGEWIAVLDADDAWLPRRLEAMLLASAAADVVCDDLLLVEDPSTDGSIPRARSWCRSVGLRFRRPHWLTLPEFIHHDLGMLKPIVRRDFVEKHGIRYDTGLRVAEDYYLYVHLLAAGARWRQLPDGYYLYSRAPHSLSSSPDAVIRQHLARSAELLADPAVNGDPAVLAAMRRHHRRSRASVAQYEILQLARRRELPAIARLLRRNPDYAVLLCQKVARHMYMSVRQGQPFALPALARSLPPGPHPPGKR